MADEVDRDRDEQEAQAASWAQESGLGRALKLGQEVEAEICHFPTLEQTKRGLEWHWVGIALAPLHWL